MSITAVELTSSNLNDNQRTAGRNRKRYPDALPTSFTRSSIDSNDITLDEDMIDVSTKEKGDASSPSARSSIRRGRSESYMSDSGDSVISRSQNFSNTSNANRRGKIKRRRMSTIDVLYQMQTAQTEVEEVTQMCAEKSIHPHSEFRMRWDLTVAICLAYNALLIPYRICFNQIATTDEFIFWFDRVIDLVFIIDVGINFYTGYVRVSDGQVELDPIKVKCNYLKGWFLLDLPASIPYELIILLIVGFQQEDGSDATRVGEAGQFLKNAKTLRVAKYIRFVKLVKVLRLCRAGKIVKRFEKVRTVIVIAIAIAIA